MRAAEVTAHRDGFRREVNRTVSRYVIMVTLRTFGCGC